MKNIIKVATIMLIFGFMATPMVFAEEETITGTVAESDQGVVISADDGGVYIVAGQDLSSMVGKVVKATGTIEESEAGKTLTITSVEEAAGGEEGAAPTEEAPAEEEGVIPPSEDEATPPAE
ncbi:MAG: hypothetical protein GY874_21525 [Desulfobacteraceae bacterium]|nr:hypothetical protein [Desulfobacteraceae bacterium]